MLPLALVAVAFLCEASSTARTYQVLSWENDDDEDDGDEDEDDALVRELLQAGCTKHATIIIFTSSASQVRHLQDIANGAKIIRFFTANLLEPGALGVRPCGAVAS